ncbi:MAG: hypothetical protein ACRDF5_07615 [bacterium]
MRNPVLTITVFGTYLVAVGLSFVLIPNLLLPLFGFPTTTEVWIRIVGLLTVILGTFFLYCARPDQRRFFQATVLCRILFALGLVVFVLLGLGGPRLILFGLADLAGAAWTGLALRAA